LDADALAALTQNPERGALGFAGSEFIERHLVKWMSESRRLSLLNVTALLAALCARFKPDHRDAFLDAAHLWARTGTFGFPGREIRPFWEG
jgi:hypothetical protein